MRFAILGSRGYPSTYGGFETFVRRFAPHVRDAGHEVTVYGRQSGITTKYAVVDGVETVETAGIDRKQLSTLLSGFTSSVHAGRRRFDAALVLNCANGLWLPMLRRAGVPTAVNVDGIEWKRDKWGRLGKATFMLGARATARYANRIIADAEEIGRIWHDEFDVDSTFIPYGADVRSDVATGDDAVRVRELGLDHGSYVLVVARLVPENNVELLLDAVDLLPDGTPVVIVGSANYDSPVQRRIDEMVARRRSVRALGHVHDQDLLSELWANCGAYFHGHSVGGTNPALLQALGHGSPTIAFDTRFNREVLADDRFLVPADPSVLSTRITALLDTPRLREDFAARGREIVARRYRWDDVCDRYLAVLEALAAQRAGSSP